MMKRWMMIAPLAVLTGATLFLGSGIADDPKTDKDGPKKSTAVEKATPKTVKVEKSTLSQSVTLKGTFEGEKSSEIQLKPKSYMGSYIIKKVADHGAMVKTGDVLIEFDTEKIDLQLKDAKQDRESAELSLKMAELEAPLSEKSYAMELAAAERDAKNAEDDAKKFLEIDRPLQVETAEQQLKSSAFFLESSKDELKQLSKMYKDKDLTEETEEIVLKRYKRNVDMSEFQYKSSKQRFEQTTKIDMPRRDITVKEGVERAKMALVRVKEIQSIGQQLKKLSLAKMKNDFMKAGEKLADLENDRKLMAKVTAPVDGMLYYGKSGRMTVGGSVMSGDVFMTVVPVNKLTFKTDAEEKDVVMLKSGNGGKITPTAYPQTKLLAKLAKIGTAPLNGKYEITAEVLENKVKVVPGMTGSLKVNALTIIDAMTVPASAVFEDDDGETKFVYDVKGGKKTVKVGVTVGEKTQILEGLAFGEEIMSSKPESGGK